MYQCESIKCDTKINNDRLKVMGRNKTNLRMNRRNTYPINK